MIKLKPTEKFKNCPDTYGLSTNFTLYHVRKLVRAELIADIKFDLEVADF